MSLAHQIMPTGEKPVPSLIRYDAACRALAEAKSVDDVKDIRDRSEAMRAYAKQAKNKLLEVDAAEIRIRAERRLGEMIAAQRDAGDLSKGAQGTGSNQHQVRVADGPAAITLAEAGIDKHLADRARKMAAIPEAEFTEIVSDWRERVERENERVSINLLKSGERHSAAQASAATISEEDREYRDLQKAWNVAGEIARGRFLAVNGITVPVAKTGEGATVTTGAAACDPASRSEDEEGRQPLASLGFTGEGEHGSPKPVSAEPDHATNPHSAPSLQAAEQTGAVPVLPTAPVTPLKALSKADQIRLLRPHCQHPGTDRCGGSGRNHCHACKKLMAEGETA